MTTQDTTTDAADLAPISTASSPDQLEEIMNVARIAANAQRDLEANGENPLDPAEEEPEAPAESEQPAQSATDAPAVEAPESAEAEAEDEEPEEASPPESTPQQSQEPTYSRRDAARFKAELDTARTDAQTLRSQLHQHQSSDAAIITQIQQQAGSEEYRKLVDKVVQGQATDEERQRASIMQQWRTVAGPIYRQAQVQVTTAWGKAFTAAGQLDGMTDEARGQIMSAADPQQALEAIHKAGIAAGTEKAQRDMQADAKKLNPDFEKLASSGKLYGVEKLT
jgi:hypothetical protein